MAFIEVIVAFIILIMTSIYFISTRKFNYWSKQKNLVHLKPVPLLGNYADYILQKTTLPELTQKICRQHPNAPMIGVFALTEPTLLVIDPDLIKLVMTKDFYYFSSRENLEHTDKEIMTKNLFFNHGDTWKVVRQNLTPLFSSSKMKSMFYLIENCAIEFEKLLETELKVSNVLEVRLLMTRFTMDCICSCAFGVNSNAMGERVETNTFQKIGDNIFDVPKLRGFKVVTRRYWPGVFYSLGLKLFPQSIYDYFNKILLDVFKTRDYKPTNRQDFVDLILGLKEQNYITGDSIQNLKEHVGKKVRIEVDDELLVAQCLIFFAAGFETSATTLSFTLYELARNKNAQEKAIAEVDAYIQSNDRLKYDCVASLPYLEQCMDEALRLYPVLGVLWREVYEKYTFPNGVTVDRGTRIHLPVYHIHRDPKNFSDPDVFKPERFSPENKHNIKPYTYFPFGEGPRICIGLRFGKMQVMAGLLSVLKNYRVELSDGMPERLAFEPKALITASQSGINLKFIPRHDKKIFGSKKN